MRSASRTMYEAARSIPAATKAGYQDLSDLERSVIVDAQEMGRRISEVLMKFGFLLTTLSRVYRDYTGPSTTDKNPYTR